VNVRRQAPGFTVQAIEVEVDPDTGFVKVLDGVVAQDAGKAINPLAVEGQMQGGLMQGLGIGLWEEMVYDRDGVLRNPNLLDYRMPTAMDIPPFETILVEVPNPEGPFGARIVGEPAIGPGAAAVANAIHDATGVRVTTAPITAERLLHAMGKLEQWERE
jgi:CO/xanthine dehydrogenase Mo-binding subunit